MTQFNLGIFGLGVKRPYELVLKKGENALISEWSWKKLGFVRKLIQIDNSGEVKVTVL